MKELTVEDVFACSIPDDMAPDDPVVKSYLTIQARAATWRQYGAPAIPLDIRFEPIEWLVTNNADEADAFQPSHDCVTCQAAADQIRAFLAEHPDRWIALGNLTYIEVWPA